ncbi:MAG: histidine kinase, partial [Proteobacteria bacterium]|nr:histidine kinase [Pseudomonadota bacterium]
RPEDGVVSVGLGLGRLVVSGEGGLRFCPRYPQSLPDFSSVDDILKNAQRHFYALNLTCGMRDPDEAGVYQPERYEVSVAANDGTLGPIGSIYSHENESIYDGISRAGTPLVTFAGVLKHELFPLARLTERLLELGAWGMGCPVELEFAVDLERDGLGRRRLAILQMRPMVVSHEDIGFDIDSYDSAELVCRSDRVFGNGRIEDIRDVLFVDPGEFERSRSVETAGEIAELNAVLQKAKRPFILIGPGRWGSSDPWLGIPVEWGQIAGAKVVVETGFEGFRVQPSEGSHFFHNMTSFRVGYFTLNPQDGEGELNLDWLRAQ